MWSRLTLFFLTALILSGAVSAQEVEGVQFFPIVARTAGVGGSQWVTDLTIHNLQDESITVGLHFFPANQANTFDTTFPDRVTIGPRETRLLEDVLSGVFAHSTDVKGALLVSADQDMIPGNPEDTQIVATTRTYNKADPAGTYGQSVPSLDTAARTEAPVVATGARNDAQFRSNVGVVNLSLFGSITFRYRVLGSDGTTIAEGSRSVPKLSVKQWSLAQFGVGSVEGSLTVELWLDPQDVSPDPCDEPLNSIIGYVSKVDNGTGDAEFLYAAPTEDIDCDW